WVSFEDALRASLSPPLWQDQPVKGDVTSTNPVSLKLRTPADLAVVTGRIVSPLSEGLGNRTVQVFDPTGQVVSSTAISDPTPGMSLGNYRVLVDPAL